MHVLVVGGSGLVGTHLRTLAHERGIDVDATYHTDESTAASIQLDVRDAERTRTVVTDADPDAVVHAAAFHAVDDCESERERAWAVNAQGTRNVAAAADAADAHLVTLSTDYVFGGEPSRAPYVESDPVNPVNFYAETKYAGEVATRIADRSTVLRPSVVYGTGGANFATWALGELEAGEEIGIVDDQTSAPTYAPDLARACLDVVERELTGTYHATGRLGLSRYEFTVTLAEVFGLDADLVAPISTAELGQDAPRPTDSTLDSTRLYDAIDYRFRGPREGFEAMRSARE